MDGVKDDVGKGDVGVVEQADSEVKLSQANEVAVGGGEGGGVVVDAGEDSFVSDGTLEELFGSKGI